MTYKKPTIEDLGSIVDHTFLAGGSGNIKGGGDPQHCDTHNEWSGGSDLDLNPKATCEGR